MRIKRYVRLSVLILAVLLTPTWAFSVSSSALTLDTTAKTVTGEHTVSYKETIGWEQVEAGDQSSTLPDNAPTRGVSAVANADGSVTLTLTAVNSKYYTSGSWFWKKYYYAQNGITTLTLINSGSVLLEVTYKDSTISKMAGDGTFFLQPNGGSVSLDVTTDVSKEETTAKAQYGKITITSVKAAKKEAINFYASKYGSYSYTIDGVSGNVAVGNEVVSELAVASESAYAGTALQATVTVTDSNYIFAGWISDGKLLGTETTLSCTTTGEMNIYPAFVPKDTIAPFTVDGVPHYFWNTAMSASLSTGKPAILACDYTLPTTLEDNGLTKDGEYIKLHEDGTIEYIVPQGAKFVVPRAEGDNGSFGTKDGLYIPTINNYAGAGGFDYYLSPIYKADDYSATYKTQDYSHAFRTLTVPSSAKITVNGIMNVNSHVFATDAKDTSQPNGAYGLVVLPSGASIEVESGGTLLCYGYISGKADDNGYACGQVIAKNGATVYEIFQVRAWAYAGVVATYYRDRLAFPISQYYIQNIETEYVLYPGASSYAAVSMGKDGTPVQAAAPFIGQSEGLFLLKSGYITREYDPYTDRVGYSVHSIDGTQGEVSLSGINLNISAMGFSYPMDSTAFILGLNGNLTINIGKNCTGTVSSRVKLLPGSQLNVETGGKLTIAESGALYIYDKEAFHSNLTFWSTEDFYTHDNSSSILDNRNTQAEVVRYSHARAAVFGADTQVKGHTFPSARLHVDGELVAYGNLYTTTGYNISETPSYVSVNNADKLLSGTGKFTNLKAYVPNSDANIGYGELEEYHNPTSKQRWWVYIPCQPVLANILADGTSTVSSDWTLNTDYYGYYQDTNSNGIDEADEFYWSTSVLPECIIKLVDSTGNEHASWTSTFLTGADLSAYFEDPACKIAATDSYDGTSALTLYVPAGARVDWKSGLKSSYYQTLQAAVVAATHLGDAVHLLRNAEPTTTAKIETWQDIAVYLNGYTVVYTDVLFDNYGALDLSLGGGKITNKLLLDTNGSVLGIYFVSAIKVQSGAELYLDLGGGTVEWTAPDTYIYTSLSGLFAPICNYAGGTVDIDLNGGTIQIDFPVGIRCANPSSGVNYSRIVSVYNGGNMTISDSSAKKTGLITNNAGNTFTSFGNTSGNPNYGTMATIYNNDVAATLVLDGVKVTNTNTASLYNTVLLNYGGSVTVTKCTLTATTNGYVLINAAGTIESITNSTFSGERGIYNWNTKSSNKMNKQGVIKLIQDTSITTDSHAIANRGLILEISGTGTIKSTSEDSYTIYNYNTAAYTSVAYTTADSGAIRTVTYDWTNIPTIGKITGSITVEGVYNTITTEGLITEISGGVVVKSTGTSTSTSYDYYTIGIQNGGKIGTIGGNVSITASGARALKIMGSSLLKKVVTCDGDTVDETKKLTEEYTYRISELTSINGASGDSDAGVMIKAANYPVYNGGYIGSIGGKFSATTSAKPGYSIINVSTPTFLNDAVAKSSEIITYTDDDSATETKLYYAHIDILGAVNSHVTLKCRTYTLVLQAYTSIDVLGDVDSYLFLDPTSTHAIELASNSYITELGRAGSEITLDTSKHGIVMAAGSSITDFCCGEGARFTFTKTGGSSETYGIKCGGTITNFGGNGSEINITMTTAGSATNGIYVSGKIVNFGDAGATINIKVTSASAKDAYGIRVHGGGEITNFGVAGSKITITALATSTANCYGVYVAADGVVKTLGYSNATKPCVQIISDHYGIYNNGTIERIDNGVVIVSKSTSTNYYTLYNANTIDLISGGDYYHASGLREQAVYNPDDQNYPTGYSLSTKTRTVTVTVPVWDAETSTYVDTELTYECYFVAMKFYATNINLGNNLDILFAIPVDRYADWTNCKVVFSREGEKDYTIDFADWEQRGISNGQSVIGDTGYYVFTYGGFAAKEMCEEVTITIYDGDTPISVMTTSIRDYATKVLNKTSDAKLRTMIVDMLNYGTACQEYFAQTDGYVYTSPANANLTEEQKAWASAPANMTGGTSPDGTLWAGSQLIVESNIIFQIKIATDAATNAEYISYQFNGHLNDNLDLVTHDQTKIAFTSTINIDELVVADADSTIEVKIYYSDGTYKTFTDSISQYMKRMDEQTDGFAVYQEFLEFAYSARTYLQSKVSSN